MFPCSKALINLTIRNLISCCGISITNLFPQTMGSVSKLKLETYSSAEKVREREREKKRFFLCLSMKRMMNWLFGTCFSNVFAATSIIKLKPSWLLIRFELIKL